MARTLRPLSGSGLTVASTPRPMLASPVKARRCHHLSRQRQPSFVCDPVSNHAEIGILMDVGLIEVDQPMVVLLGTGQQASDLLDKGLSALRVGLAEQFAGLLPRQLQAMQGAADRLAAAGATKRLLHPADQAPQGPAWG